MQFVRSVASALWSSATGADSRGTDAAPPGHAAITGGRLLWSAPGASVPLERCAPPAAAASGGHG